MTGLLQAVDGLTEARRMFDAAMMAVEALGKCGLDAEDERAAIGTVMVKASRTLEAAIDAVEQERLGRKAVRE